MRHIAEAVDLPAKLAGIAERRQAWRAERVLTYGWPEDVRCPNCGDTGREPEPPYRTCFCTAGAGIRDVEDREARWALTVPRRFRRWSLDSHPRQDLVPQVREWAAHGWREGRNLVVLGPVGTGKTGLAVGALRDVFVRGGSVKFGTVPSLLDQIRPSREAPDEPRRELRSLTSVDVLLLDDIGVHKATDWTAERLYVIVNDRHEDGRPTITTSNCTLAEMEAAVGPRTISRLMDDAVMIHVGGEDRRFHR